MVGDRAGRQNRPSRSGVESQCRACRSVRGKEEGATSRQLHNGRSRMGKQRATEKERAVSGRSDGCRDKRGSNPQPPEQPINPSPIRPQRLLAAVPSCRRSGRRRNRACRRARYTVNVALYRCVCAQHTISSCPHASVRHAEAVALVKAALATAFVGGWTLPSLPAFH